MNKIDILLNSIAQKHLRVECVETDRSHMLDFQPLCNSDIHAALLAAFQGGVRYAGRAAGKQATMIHEVDICLD